MSETDEFRPGFVVDARTTWCIWKKRPDSFVWVACTSERADPADVLSVLDFHKHAYPEDEHRLVCTEVLVSVTNEDEVRALVPPKDSAEDETDVPS